MPVHHMILSRLLFLISYCKTAVRDKEPCGFNKDACLQFSLRKSSLKQLIIISSFFTKFRLQSVLFFYNNNKKK